MVDPSPVRRPSSTAPPAAAIPEQRPPAEPHGEPPPPHGDPTEAPPEATVVVLAARDVRLPDVLRHLEAGRTVLVVSAPPDEPSGGADT
ncbi:hypothetical protein BL253_28560 [Pseudofrankia asymbiotica]|uniref:Uncharacterized protein n=1 Tax=Pseudofrankia asymbiotica TaxID=1834516 RepID=A0A1V2I5L9_9ACTN|nr:hypothetical protein BL253_28560 [Pseudofrankia asymbiotica]